MVFKYLSREAEVEAIVRPKSNRLADILKTANALEIRAAMTSLACLIKALVIRSEKIGFDLLTQTLALVGDINVAHDACHSIELIIGNDPQGYLSKQSFCKEKVNFISF